MGNVAEFIYIPEALRERLGEQASKELVEVLNQAVRSLHKGVDESTAERIERRIAETKTEIIKEIAGAKTELLKWMLVFWVGQVLAIVAFLYTLLR
ncbi:hypothetical protein Adeg_0715 [Ammonifex degensii KC4]|uniref:DUF1640 domain-containing protein n=1 Tax=Ammonifex degensii (strain DSM 10501 / KC4) TaxID=429009 RepID=C9RC85_AMMDK|nr:hypothetical protein [Ammonifex degensii]ACX51862.1 hypothetical protein Adeg_0715 [Ammonifex degensii KC4]